MMNNFFSIVDRVLPRLSHVNPAVVLTSVKVIIKCMDHMTSAENIKALSKKIGPSLGKYPKEKKVLK